METVYTAKATASGGRNGQVKSEDGTLDIEVRMPREMGGPGGHFANPEVLFASGYAACFDSALNTILQQEKVQAGTSIVTASVNINKLENGRFVLSVVLEIEVPGVERSTTEIMVRKAHEICLYSNAVQGNIDVQLIVK